jgi:hypothetical protein
MLKLSIVKWHQLLAKLYESLMTEIGKRENLYCMKLYHVSQKRPISWRIGSGYVLICL